MAGTTRVWTTFTYDKLGRVTKEVGPDGSLAETDYDGLCTSVRVYTGSQDSAGQKTTRCQNSQDQVVSVVDANQKTTGYEYDPFGSLTKTIDAQNNQAVMEYDVRGRKIRMVDPDMGEWTYVYDAVGNLREQVSPEEAANQKKTWMNYDKLDRLILRGDADGASAWVYDQSPRTSGGVWLGKLWKTGPILSAVYEREHLYDDLGRPREVKTKIDGETFSTETTYDTAGRVKDVTYPSGFAVENVYNATGYLSKVKNAATGGLYWEGLDADVDFKMTEERLGDGAVNTLRSYRPLDGMLESITSTGGASGDLQALGYDFDWLGNLVWRRDQHGSADLRERFEYDVLNRLKKAILEQNQVPVSTTNFDYDDIGNLTFKGDVGTYAYNANRPHAVANVSGPDAGDYWGSYAYDANGNMTSGPGRSLTWTAFNNVASITKGGVTTSFTYDPDRARYKSETQNGGVTEKTLYVGSLFESVRVGANQTDRHYIHAGGAPIAVHTARNTAASDVQYLLRDHLGSVDVIADASGGEVERFSYDAWGKRRLVNWLPDGGIPILPLTDITDRGFTNHEHFELVGIIHMNGRVYDPTLGRFLSPDPFVQALYQPQNLNRYSYVLNNPLSFTDPTGHFFKKVGKFFKKYGRVIAAVAVAAVIAWAAPMVFAAMGWTSLATMSPMTGAVSLTFTGSVVTGAVAGASAGAIATGSVRGAAWGALSGAVFGAIGSAITDPAIGVAAHGVAGGTLDEIRGGRFLAGFLAAGFTKSANVAGLDSVDTGSSFGDAVAAATSGAVMGGTGSVIGGGKFANGAVTGAFSAVLNDYIHRDTLQVAADFSAGFGDIITSGFGLGRLFGLPSLTQIARETMPYGDTVDYDSTAYLAGNVTGAVVGGTPIIARGLAAAAYTKPGDWLYKARHLLNHNRYLRIGPGGIPKGRPLTYGPGQNVPTLRIGTARANVFNHHDLRILGR